jgi:hypothetical protein
MHLLSPHDVLQDGLRFVHVKYNPQKSNASQQKIFHKHYASSPVTIANMWYDIQTTELPVPDHKGCPSKVRGWLNIGEKEKSEKGFKMFMISHYFVWTYEKNSGLIASRFGICERYARGECIWKWLARIAALKDLKIYSPDSIMDKNLELFPYTIDGVDCLTREIKHPKFNIDKGACSHKFNKCAAKYELAISVHHARCCYINGPYKGGEHDLKMFRQGKMKKKMQDLSKMGKKAIVDSGYRSSATVDEKNIFSFPDKMDSKELHAFKTRARLRHETFNGRLKMFNILQNRFRHGFDMHHFAFVAVVVIVQYQMDNGSPIFSV